MEDAERRPAMEIRFGKRKRIRFSDKSHPTRGIVSVGLGILSLIVLVVLCIVSGRAKGNAGIGIGFAGIWALGMSIAGFILAVRCSREEDIYMATPAVGSVLNGVLTLILMMLFFKGAM